MAYVCELNPGHRIYLDNQGDQTTITVTLQRPGQQQQTSNTMATGAWTAPPEAYQSDTGAVFKLLTTQGKVCISVQGNRVSTTSNVSSTASSSQQLSVQQTTTVPTGMQPMQSTDTMSMTMNSMPPIMNSMTPMEMRMGTMELKMDTPNPQPQATTVRNFCSQCGTKVTPEDRFCSSCGHRLG